MANYNTPIKTTYTGPTYWTSTDSTSGYEQYLYSPSYADLLEQQRQRQMQMQGMPPWVLQQQMQGMIGLAGAIGGAAALVEPQVTPSPPPSDTAPQWRLNLEWTFILVGAAYLLVRGLL